jgi:hypothetical protein
MFYPNLKLKLQHCHIIIGEGKRNAAKDKVMWGRHQPQADISTSRKVEVTAKSGPEVE